MTDASIDYRARRVARRVARRGVGRRSRLSGHYYVAVADQKIYSYYKKSRVESLHHNNPKHVL
jgi:hypothetical protein